MQTQSEVKESETYGHAKTLMDDADATIDVDADAGEDNARSETLLRCVLCIRGRSRVQMLSGIGWVGWLSKPTFTQPDFSGFDPIELGGLIGSVGFMHRPTQNSPPFPWKCIWRSHMPSKVAFFTWTASLGKILTLDNLRKRGIIVMDWCFICKKNGETVDHLLLHCEVPRALWDGIFGRTGLAWAMPLRVVDLLACRKGLHGCTQVDVAWKMVSLYLLWFIWMEWNEWCFNDNECTLEQLWNFFVHSLLFWFSALVTNASSVHDFLMSLSISWNVLRCFLLYTSCVHGLCLYICF
ncbi:uncharacterized protein LOC122291257 [Carya illinoinensis]|uniref:uncharacterized protein LOC122291257 n=1 Tax=Carya illinoinensis TaxID=32201 RepID=UPI001C71958E|nr:uncharacterized protein LOC122291257 [Carya illinoinensis]